MNAFLTITSLDEAILLRMQAYIYRSRKKEDTYVFLAKEDGFDVLPAGLDAQLAPWDSVMTLELHPERKLARGNAAAVMENLSQRGFHLQFPPASTFDPMSSDWGTDA